MLPNEAKLKKKNLTTTLPQQRMSREGTTSCLIDELTGIGSLELSKALEYQEQPLRLYIKNDLQRRKLGNFSSS